MPNSSPTFPNKPTPVQITVAEAIILTAGWADRTDHHRRLMATTLRMVEELDQRPYEATQLDLADPLILAGKRPAEAILLDPVRSLALLERASPKALGIAPGTLLNRISALRYILRRLGMLASLRPRAPEITDPRWRELVAALPEGPDYSRLRTFAATCAADGIVPAEVSWATLNAAAERRAAERGGAKAHDYARRVGVQWNRAAKLVPGWPQTRLGQRANPRQYSLPFDAYPPSLVAEVEAYLTDIGAPKVSKGLFSGESRPDPVKPSTVTTRMYCLRRLLWGAVQGGISKEDLTNLRVVATPAFAMASLNWHFCRAGEVNADLGQMAATIASVAQYLKLPEPEWAALKPVLAKATPPARTEITERTARLLDQLADRTRRLKLLHLPEYLMREAARMRDGLPDRRGKVRPPQPEAAAWLAATAVAIEILLHAPMRLINLQTLRLGTELQLSQVTRGQWRGTIFLAAASVKNKRRLEVPLQPESIALIRAYLNEHRPSLPGVGSTWLFPGHGGPDRPRHKGAFGQAITEAVEQWVGVRLNPHAFRALAGAMILEANPHAIDDVRAILGHACFETAMIYYRRCCQRDASDRLSGAIAGQRSTTRLDASFYFLEQGLRRRPRRAR